MNEIQLSIILEFKGPTAFFCQLKNTCFAFVPQAWTTEKSWSKWNVVTGCPAPRTVPAPCTSSCSNAGRGTPRSGPPLSIYKPSWRITSLPLNHNTNLGTTSKHGAPAEYRVCHNRLPFKRLIERAFDEKSFQVLCHLDPISDTIHLPLKKGHAVALYLSVKPNIVFWGETSVSINDTNGLFVCSVNSVFSFPSYSACFITFYNAVLRSYPGRESRRCEESMVNRSGINRFKDLQWFWKSFLDTSRRMLTRLF